MKRVVVAFPGAVVRASMWNRPDLVFFDEAGWWVTDGTSRRVVETFSFPVAWHDESDPSATIAALKVWSPVWTRWTAHADQYELLYREALMYVCHLKAALAELEIGHVVFHTGISHHLDSSLLELACVQRDIAQTFLYANTVTGRLLPMRQRRSIVDRCASSAIVSDNDAAADIESFRANTKAGKPPAIGFFDGRLQASALFGAMNAAYQGLRPRVSRAIARAGRRSRTAAFFDQFGPLGTTDFIRLIRTQRNALRYFRRRVRSEPLTETIRGVNAPSLLLAAHYQPEASSFPEGGDFHNHIDIAIKVRTLGYDGPILYKEHMGSAHYFYPIIHQTRVGMSRSESYYERLEELGCVFVNPYSPIPIDAETNQRFAPITITGSVALERSLLGFRTIVAGHPWYKGLPGTIGLTTTPSLDGAALRAPATNRDLSGDAFAFLHAMLSRKTILNAPGIGCGEPMTDGTSVAVFTNEFNRFLDQL